MGSQGEGGITIRLGLVTYTNLASGLGVFGHDFLKYLGADSILSIDAGVKGQEQWTERQVTAKRPPSQNEIRQYFERFKPDVVMFMETPFSMNLYEVARRYNCKTVGVVMHETFEVARLAADLLICPSFEAYRKVQRDNKKLLFLPIGLELFPFKLRTGHDFVLNIGYGGPHDRRQSVRVVQAFSRLEDPDARLIVNSQANNWPKEIAVIQDSRITYNLESKPLPKDIYSEGDIAINVMAYGGYERPILESMASGMPCLTVNADPMNLFQHDSDFLIEPTPWHIKSSQWVVDTWYNAVTVEQLVEKFEWLLTIDTPKYSRWARAQAVAQSWEGPIDYKSVWQEALESA